ncbi:MAG: hypothetical protein WBF66_08700 [Dehalococcoidia bacterium]
MTTALRSLAASLLLRLADPLWRSSCRRSQRDSRTRALWRRFWRAAAWLAPHLEKEIPMNGNSRPDQFYHTPEQLALQHDLDHIAPTLGLLHASDQVHWLAYLLQALEATYSTDEFTLIAPVLWALLKAIADRLEQGSW